MEITSVQIKLAKGAGRLLAFASVVFDGVFVVRDLKLVEGAGRRFVSMPARCRQDKCVACGQKNHLLACFCNRCGVKLCRESKVGGELFADVCCPIDASFREELERAILTEYVRVAATAALALARAVGAG